ncbi:hypothetical protein ACIA59_10615 [Micromonospora haikouensis]|uniref:hypothetical protein n=1 Tax=Micromonospora haikouensis TaxID=686309 RepID=UPI0037BAAEBD
MAGTSAALTSQWTAWAGGPAADVTGLTVRISPLGGGPAVVGPTSTGITREALGLYSYTWAIPPDTAAGEYLVLWSADGGIQASEVVTVTTAGAADGYLYATLSELRGMRRIDDSASDLLLGKALAAASRQIDRKTGRRFWLDAAPTARVFGAAGRLTTDGLLLVDDIGSVDGLTVESSSGSTWSPVASPEFGPVNALGQGWPYTEVSGPWHGTRLRVTARWGWPAVPEEIGMATLLLASRLYLRQDSPEGLVRSAEFGSARLSRWDPDVESLISPYALLAVA